jgi:hypothetical protein
MRNPTPVMISRNKVESWSMRNEKGITRSPTLIKFQNIHDSVEYSLFMNIIMLMTNEPRTVPQPMALTIPLVRKFLPSPQMRKPSKGRTGISRINVRFIKLPPK